MKLALTILCFSLLVATSSLRCSAIPLKDEHSWEEFKARFKKDHSDKGEEEKRQNIWKENLKFIKTHNAKHDKGQVSFRMAANQLADLSPEERKQRRTLIAPPHRDFSEDLPFGRLLNSSSPATARISMTCTVASSVNYTRSSCLPPVKNQGYCASCWAFAALTALEWQACKTSKVSTILSEQQLVDCSNTYGTFGCDGGWYDDAWRYIQDAGGVTTSSIYPYTAQTGTCRFDKSTAVISVSSFGFINPKDFTSMRCYLQSTAPLSAAIHAISSFDYYSSGIYDDPNCSSSTNDVNHGIVIVGHGTLNGIRYWIIRNSEGTSWGDKGYMLMRAEVNMCGIENWVAIVFK